MLYVPIYLAFILTTVLVAFFAERKLSAYIQNRLGPYHVGPWGLLQPFADLLKLIQKEDITPNGINKPAFKTAPVLVFLATVAGFCVLPLWPGGLPSAVPVGLFFLISIISADVIGLMMAGLASNSKFSLLGALRVGAQIVSYEVPLGLAVLAVVAYAGTLNLEDIATLQTVNAPRPTWLLGIKNGWDTRAVGGFLSWNIVTMPTMWVLFFVYYIAALAESNRAPFDIPEGESEIIAGFHTEYTGFRFSLFFLSEYALMVLLSALAAFLFFGGYATPLPNIGPLPLANLTQGQAGTLSGALWGVFWLASKSLFLVFTQIWVRWTFPRLRADQLTMLGWKVLTPLAMVLFVLVALWTFLLGF